VRTWRWLARHSDLTKPPLPALRWGLLLILGLCCWAARIPLEFKDWLGPIIIAGALILPDVAGFGIAGMRLDLKRAEGEIASLRQDMKLESRAASISMLALGTDPEALARAAKVLSQQVAKVSSDEASGEGRRWQGAFGVDRPREEDVTS
jgi:hypothetical protein